MGYAPYEFLLPQRNTRTDAYGGSLENRARLLRQILEDMKEAVGRNCAVALRFSSDALLKAPGEGLPSEAHEIVSLLAEVPDLWDVKSADWTVETASARARIVTALVRSANMFICCFFAIRKSLRFLLTQVNFA